VSNLKFYIIKKENRNVLQGGEFDYNTLPSVTHSVGKVLPAIPKRKLMHFPSKNINLFYKREFEMLTLEAQNIEFCDLQAGIG
jgi:hypothetical protein